VQKPWLGDTGDGQRTIEAPLAPTNELEAMVELHLEALTVKQYSEQTIKARRDQLKVFLRWCAGQAFTSPREITSPPIGTLSTVSLFIIARRTANYLASGLNTECSYRCGFGFDE
jgi:hypothetical protein